MQYVKCCCEANEDDQETYSHFASFTAFPEALNSHSFLHVPRTHRHTVCLWSK